MKLFGQLCLLPREGTTLPVLHKHFVVALYFNEEDCVIVDLADAQLVSANT